MTLKLTKIFTGINVAVSVFLPFTDSVSTTNNIVTVIDSQTQGNDFFGKEEYVLNSMDIINNKESDTMSIKQQNRFGEWISYINYLIGDNDIEINGENYAFGFIETIRKLEEYPMFIFQLTKSNEENAKKVLLMFLANSNFEFVSACEERFVVDSLASSNVLMQEFALNVILLWDNITNVETIRNITIKNKYLNNDLKEFIQKR